MTYNIFNYLLVYTMFVEFILLLLHHMPHAKEIYAFYYVFRYVTKNEHLQTTNMSFYFWKMISNRYVSQTISVCYYLTNRILYICIYSISVHTLFPVSYKCTLLRVIKVTFSIFYKTWLKKELFEKQLYSFIRIIVLV